MCGFPCVCLPCVLPCGSPPPSPPLVAPLCVPARRLHDREISSFLVTNAQFPDQIRTLTPVTQLYVSIDAATRDTLKAVDRPLFTDFWERYLGACVHATLAAVIAAVAGCAGAGMRAR